jgi:hypothetical protein
MLDFNFLKSPGVIINQDIFPIDINIIKEMVGFHEEKIKNLVNDILENEHTKYTISYFLLLEKLKRKKKKVNRGFKTNLRGIFKIYI